MMKWTLPNQLTVARVFISAGFFVVLGLYGPEPSAGAYLLVAALGLFLLAVITDVLDGHLARKLNQVSAFGRMVDPICDKVLVVGAFVMLAGPNYQLAALHSELERSLPVWLTGGMASSVQPWMPVVILAREFIVSGLRGYSESQGLQFPATPAGKMKMLIQSVAIGTVLFILAFLPDAGWAVWVKIPIVWLSVVVTVLSGFVYVRRARALLRGSRE